MELDLGNVVNENSVWNLTGILVNEMEVPVNQTICSKQNKIINAFLPIPELTREDAIDLCKKFGQDVYIAGDFETKEAFDYYYDGLHSNQKYVDQCGFYDNGRLKTWLPYKSKSGQLAHEITGQPLLPNNENKFLVDWFSGASDDPLQCGSAYFGIVPQYNNIGEDYCSAKERLDTA